ncbi:MAG: AEC family transporter [Rhizobiales bacterium]|nr:AEC family transporter [Hyphomicrobiales bacterium]
MLAETLSEVLSTVTPVFGLIALGYASARTGLLAASAGAGLSAFVFTIAMPALLFRTLATVEAPPADQVLLLVGYMSAVAATWLIASLVSLFVLRRPPSDSAAISMAAAFGNTVMLGIPLVLGHFGEAALAPLAAIIAIHAPLLWLAATLQITWTTPRAATSTMETLLALTRDLARNPIILGIVLGSLYGQTGLPIPGVADKLLALLAAAGVPGALFALGMSLAQYSLTAQPASLLATTAIKLVMMPALAWLIAGPLLGLAPLWIGVIVLLAAVPTGANAYLFASKHECAVGTVSGAIALGTLISFATISALLVLLSP